MVSNHYRTQTTTRTTGALPAFKVAIDSLFEGTQVVSTWKHCRR